MANKMIIDASHPEETRVVVLRGNRIEEFDFEAANKKPLRGNIYLAKVTRVEPSLQAAFVEYGGNRHGFLAFSEIHPDYYQIPVADRQALLEDEARQQREEDDDEGRGERRSRRSRRHNHERAEKRTPRTDQTLTEDIVDTGHEADETAVAEHESGPHDEAATHPEAGTHHETVAHAQPDHSYEPKDQSEAGHHSNEHNHDDHKHLESSTQEHAVPADHIDEAHHAHDSAADQDAHTAEHDHHEQPLESRKEQDDHSEDEEDQSDDEEDGEDEEEEQIENLGGDDIEEMPARPYRSRRQYKIQEVIKRRQVLLVQVVKEERGNKGAALTTYLSLAGRYSVLMPNTARGGGISRKITELGDRKRLKSIVQELEVPEGMGIILRTAGASRTKPEIKRDFEYLLRMWETVREVTLRSTAPTLVYEEGSLIKRTIRDLYSKEIDDITVSGEAAFREARNFMRLLMPSHVKAVVPWREQQPVFARFGIESQLDAMFSSQVTLRSGGYIVINQTEALVAIDVNSGRSTREHNIEDTALRTNLEAADEVSRQLRLRDLAGLIVVDFIDMEENRNNRAVERRLKEALKNDRARIQVGRISHFGLLEMSRQRMRPGVLEGSTIPCPHCSGSGLVRSKSSLALHVLRIVEDALIKNAAFNLTVRMPSEVALYILNQKRSHLREIERRFGVTIEVLVDDTLSGTVFHALERGEPAVPPIDFEIKSDVVQIDSVDMGEFEDEVEEIEDESDDEQEAHSAGDDEAGEGEQARASDEERDPRRRRRRRRRGRGDRESSGIDSAAPQPSDDGLAFVAEIGGDIPGLPAELAPMSDGEVDDVDAEADATLIEGQASAEEQRRRRRRRPRRGRRDGQAQRADGEQDGEGSGEQAPQPFADRQGYWVQSNGEQESGSQSVTQPEPKAYEPKAYEPSSYEPAASAPIAAAPIAAAPIATAPSAEKQAHSEPAAPPAPPPSRLLDAPEAEAPANKKSGWWQRAKATFGG